MPVPRVDEPTARALARSVLGAESFELEEIRVGFGNQNWRLSTSRGDRVLKIGPAASAPKWKAAETGVRLAMEAGLPVPQMHTSALIGDHIVRVFDWIEGSAASALVDGPESQAQLGAELGTAIAALHRTSLDWYGSRLDGSAETFATWAAYVEHRLAQIEDRAAANSAPASALRRQAGETIATLASEVSAHARPVVCHRDLHADNLLVESDGSLRAILDWDMPEAWDQAGEWFKLETMLFGELPHAQQPFDDAYRSAHPERPAWSDRRRLVTLIENLNVVANDRANDPAFTAEAITRLEELTEP